MEKKKIYIEEDYVSFKTAKKLVKAGFTQIPRVGMEATLYDKKGKSSTYANYGVMYSGLSEGYIPRPTLQMAKQWIWEKYKIHLEVWIIEKGVWAFDFFDKNGKCVDENLPHTGWPTQAEALEDGILYVLKIK